MLATTIDTLNIPPLRYPVVQQIQATAESPIPTYIERPDKGFRYILSNSSTVTTTTEVVEFSVTVQDSVEEAFKPKTELGKQLLALRYAYIEKGGKLLDTDALDQELRLRRGGATNA